MSHNDLFRKPLGDFRGATQVTSLMKFSVLTSFLTSHVSYLRPWARRNCPALLKNRTNSCLIGKKQQSTCITHKPKKTHGRSVKQKGSAHLSWNDILGANSINNAREIGYMIWIKSYFFISSFSSSVVSSEVFATVDNFLSVSSEKSRSKRSEFLKEQEKKTHFLINICFS